MPVHLPSILLLAFCWIASLAILLIFLESWFGVPERNRFVARRASGAYGICSVFVILRGPVKDLERTVRSIFGQSYPFVELFLIYPEDDSTLAALAQEFRARRTHVAVRLVPVPHAVETSADRIRALEHAQPSARGRWYAVIEGGVLLDQFALEASLEFAGTGEISALSLRPGTQASSWMHRVLAPSMEYFFQMLRLVERRRTARSKSVAMDAPYLLLNRDAFEVLHRINRLPGILNEAGWTVWSYQMEGLRVFDGDGSRWLWREIGFASWPDFAVLDKRVARNAGIFVSATTLASLVPVAGMAYVFLMPITGAWEASVLALSASAVSYALMTLSYFLSARKLHAATWFAPLYFLVQPIAALLTFRGVRAAMAQARAVAEASSREGRSRRHSNRRISRGASLS